MRHDNHHQNNNNKNRNNTVAQNQSIVLLDIPYMVIRSLTLFMLGNSDSCIQLGNGFFYGLHQCMILSCQ